MAKMQQMSLDELINLRRAERDTNDDKAQRRLERLSHKLGWSPETKRTIEKLTRKQHAARGDGDATIETRERDNEQHESSDNSDNSDTSDSDIKEDEEHEQQAHEEMSLRQRMEDQRKAHMARRERHPPAMPHAARPEPAGPEVSFFHKKPLQESPKNLPSNLPSIGATRSTLERNFRSRHEANRPSFFF